MPEDFPMSQASTCATHFMNYTHQSHSSNVSSLEHHLWQRRAAEEDFWGASASGWHCKTSSREEAAEQGLEGGTAAHPLHTHISGWTARGIRYSIMGMSQLGWCGEESCWGGRGMGTVGGEEASARGLRCCSSAGQQQCALHGCCRVSPVSGSAEVRINPHGTEPIHVHMVTLLKGRSSSSILL